MIRQQPCPFCGGASATAIHFGQRGTVFRCFVCGGRFNQLSLNPSAMYDADYFNQNYAPRESEQIRVFRGWLTRLMALTGGGRLLDYGCGSGVFLRTAAEVGFHPNTGVDVSPEALKLAGRRQTEGTVLGGPEVVSGRFAAICLVDSLAHIPEAAAVLGRLVRDHLGEDGVVFVRTPILSPGYFLYVQTLARLLPPRFIDGLYGLPGRYMMATRPSLERFFVRAGLTVQSWEECPEFPSAQPRQGLRGWVKHQLFSACPRRLNPAGSLAAICRPAAGPAQSGEAR